MIPFLSSSEDFNNKTHFYTIIMEINIAQLHFRRIMEIAVAPKYSFSTVKKAHLVHALSLVRPQPL